jgi:hypothetical protein
MELEFPGFVLMLLMAIGLLAFGPGPHAVRERLDRMAGVTAAIPCAGAAPSDASHFFGAPTPPVACTVY